MSVSAAIVSDAPSSVDMPPVLVDVPSAGDIEGKVDAKLSVIKPFSAKPIFGRKRKKMFFRKFYIYFSFYAREKYFK